MRNSNNYQTFYKDAIKNKKGYVTKDYAIHLQQYLQVDSFDYILENNSTDNNILEKNIDDLLNRIV